ncbi:MAG: response regulator, partial [Catalinimonas sp.]
MSSFSPKRLQFLIVDDNSVDFETFCRFLRRSLEPKREVEIKHATSVHAGVEAFREHPPDCMLLDYRLPDGDGIQLLNTLVQHPIDKPFCAIVLTASGNERIAVDAMKSGATDYLVKDTIDADRLHATVLNAMEKSRLAYELKQQREALELRNQELLVTQSELEAKQKELMERQAETNRMLTIIEEDNLRKTRELAEARELQISMLPQQSPKLSWLNISNFMNTSEEVGGDYYDFKLGDDDQFLLTAIGDATGHGLKAGIVVATAKSYFQTLGREVPTPVLMERI